MNLPFDLGAGTIAKILGGGAAIGVIASSWGKIMMVLHKIKSIFITEFDMRGYGYRSVGRSAIIYYLKKHYKCVGGRKWDYSIDMLYLKHKQRYSICAFKRFIPINDITILVKKWSLLFVTKMGGRRDEFSDDEDMPFVIWSFRGLLNPDKLMTEAIEEYDEFIKTGLAGSSRYSIIRKAGDRGSKMNFGSVTKSSEIDPDNKTYKGSSSQKAFFAEKQGTLDPLGFEWNDVVHDGSPGKEIYSLNDELRERYNEVAFWLEHKSYYYERGMPWKKGWLISGVPGSGKTAFIRYMAKHLDLPLVIFDLSTFSNNDFVEEWNSIEDHVPCIALIEDIDSVYNGRKNITDTDMDRGVTFDCLLNCLDGIKRTDGLFVIITTNHPETIDPAIGQISDTGNTTRPGRIDKIIQINELDEQQRTDIANSILIDFEKEEIDEIVKSSEDVTGAVFVDKCICIAERKLYDIEGSVKT